MTDTVTWAPGAWPVHRHEDVDAMLVRVGRAEARRQRRQDHRNGRTAGAFLIAIWASAVVSSILLEGVPTAAYLLPGLSFCTGLACLAIPWERISPSWLHVALATATVEIAIWVALADASYGVFYVLLAAYAGYVSRRRREVAALVALMFLALVAPLLYESDRVAVTGHAVLIMSVVAAVSVMAAWARGQVRARQRLYRQFALEALQLAIRIRGDALPPQPLEVGPDAPAAHAGSAAQNGPGTEASEHLAAELDPTAAPSAAIAAGSS
jgi:hypothetical protein